MPHPDRLDEVRTRALGTLLAERNADGYWEGELASSAISTATALFALELHGRSAEALRRRERREAVEAAATWLVNHANPDGGWGDTVTSPSNISTTALVWAALKATVPGRAAGAIGRAEQSIGKRAGGIEGDRLARVITGHYGRDRTFAVPILTMCALAGCLGSGAAAWSKIPALPFELAVFPHRLFRFLGLPVVSYALPALIAIGQAQHHHSPSANPLIRIARRCSRARTLRVLQEIQPQSGGFLEAVPLTAFVCMSLISIGLASHPVVESGIRFLDESRRADGSWPIDSNLSCWVTSLAVNGLAGAGRLEQHLSAPERERTARWLLKRQFQTEHPYTRSPPGGWAWTHLSGGVPDADDTSAALLALHHLSQSGAISASEAARSAHRGVEWLLGLQNRDGGIPTFCRGWGKLDFDRSAPDLTAHALRAWQSWRDRLPPALGRRLERAGERAVRYLIHSQRREGCWIPLWFGNQEENRKQNPVYGTSRVLLAARTGVGSSLGCAWEDSCRRARHWLISAQNGDGGWGGGGGVPSSIEETGWAVEALASAGGRVEPAASAIRRGYRFLIRRSELGRRFEATPIGLYFAQLWYSERLYPLISCLSAWEASASLESELSEAESAFLSSRKDDCL